MGPAQSSTVSRCPGWNCSTEGQSCTQGPGYCCRGGRWQTGGRCTVSRCPGWTCSQENQRCTQGPGYCCKNERWQIGACHHAKCNMDTGIYFKQGEQIGEFLPSEGKSEYWHATNRKYYTRWTMPPNKKHKGYMTQEDCRTLRNKTSESPLKWLNMLNDDIYVWSGGSNAQGANCYRYHGSEGGLKNLDKCRQDGR